MLPKGSLPTRRFSRFDSQFVANALCQRIELIKRTKLFECDNVNLNASRLNDIEPARIVGNLIAASVMVRTVVFERVFCLAVIHVASEIAAP